MMGRWFHRNISGIEAQKLLEKFGQDGSFLIRSSQSTANSYTLSVRCAGGGIKHIKIQNSTDSGFEIGQGSGDQFATLSELVEHFIMKESLRDKMDGSIIVLKYPLSPKEPTCERYFHGSISGKEASELLLAKGKLGSYLVRESRTDPQNYVLSVLCENQKVVHLVINCNERGYTTPNLDKYFPTLDEFIANCIKMCPIVDVKDNVVYLKQPLNCSRVNAMNFNTRCQELEAESRLRNKNGLSEEFEALQQADGKFLFERKDGCKPENRAKNRFKTILPFDYNRIKLLNRGNTPDDSNDSDYINANRIKCDDTFGKVYLATQGPLNSTMGDFWEMIWQERCQIILMITHEEEKGRVKCAKYWPNDSSAKVSTSEETYGRINVKLVRKTLVCDDYLMREFLISCPTAENAAADVVAAGSRKCFQFQYLAWSDHGVPENPQVTLNFVEHFNKLYSELHHHDHHQFKAPVTVHCSAGIGRTGAIIVIDHLIDKLNTYGLQCDIDIYKTVHQLRSQRSGMIQTEKQYQFLYSIIRLYIDEMLGKLNNRSDHRSIESDFLVSNNNNIQPVAASTSSGGGGTSQQQTARKLNTYFTSTPKSLSLQSINVAPTTTSSNQLLNNMPVRK